MAWRKVLEKRCIYTRAAPCTTYLQFVFEDDPGLGQCAERIGEVDAERRFFEGKRFDFLVAFISSN